MSQLKNKLSFLNQKHNNGFLNQSNSNPRTALFSLNDLDIPNIKSEGWVPDTSVFQAAPHEVEQESLMAEIPSSIIIEDSAYLHLTRNMMKFWTGWDVFNSVFYREIESILAANRIFCLLNKKECLVDIDSNWIFLDIETCGFVGNPLFLIGVAFFQNGKFELHQLFARNYEEEKAVLGGFWKMLEEKEKDHIIVTFNGKSFDWPFIQERSWVHNTLPKFDMEKMIHLDLMHIARKMWKAQLPDCRLQTLEKYFLNRYRVNDVHGGLIPDAYQKYVENPKERKLIVGAIHHNALDIISLGELLLYWGLSQKKKSICKP